jgi:hypothetical protein
MYESINEHLIQNEMNHLKRLGDRRAAYLRELHRISADIEGSINQIAQLQNEINKVRLCEHYKSV